MAYITPVATVTKWFPDKRGLASGMVVMGFGLGAFFYGFILKAIPGFVTASKHAGAYADAKAAAVKAGTAFDPTAYAITPADIGAVHDRLPRQRHRLRDHRRALRDAAQNPPPATPSPARPRPRPRTEARSRRRKCCARRSSICCG